MENLIQNLYNLDNKIAYNYLKELEVISYTSNEVYKFFETFVEMLDNKNTKEIAEILNISEKTVRNHISNTMQKLGVKGRASAVVELIKLNEIEF